MGTTTAAALYRLDMDPLRLSGDFDGLENLANKRVHWGYRQRLYAAIREAIEKASVRDSLLRAVPIARSRVAITVWKPGRLWDKDGLYSACKPVLDGIVARRETSNDAAVRKYLIEHDIRRWGLILEDAVEVCDEECVQFKAPRWAVRVEVWKVE